jgi:hypothetical protein
VVSIDFDVAASDLSEFSCDTAGCEIANMASARNASEIPRPQQRTSFATIFASGQTADIRYRFRAIEPVMPCTALKDKTTSAARVGR